jgi:hypothetical protein
MAATGDSPTLVTTALISPAEERNRRQRRYLITMAVRVVAFILAIVLTTGWIRVVMVTLALVLPWVAVVAANAAPARPAPETPSLYHGEKRRELE